MAFDKDIHLEKKIVQMKIISQKRPVMIFASCVLMSNNAI